MKISNSLIVLAIPNGGVILGDIIASHFHCNLDIIVLRNLRAQFNEELVIGAVMPDGTYFINQNVFKVFDISKECLYNETENQK